MAQVILFDEVPTRNMRPASIHRRKGGDMPSCDHARLAFSFDTKEVECRDCHKLWKDYLTQ